MPICFISICKKNIVESTEIEVRQTDKYKKDQFLKYGKMRSDHFNKNGQYDFPQFYKNGINENGKKVSDLIKIYRVVESLIDLIRNLQNKNLTDKIIIDIYEDLKRNVEIISKISKMIEKGIDMSGPRDN
jgi:hypothetical protein